MPKHNGVVNGSSVLRRAIAILMLIALAPVAHAALACAGWSGSPAERMACCDREGAGCDSLFADSCCADGEQRQNIETPAALITVADSAGSAPAPVLTTGHTALPAEPHLHDQQTATYLLDSVFRI